MLPGICIIINYTPLNDQMYHSEDGSDMLGLLRHLYLSSTDRRKDSFN
jgi:hypothetical protein